MSIAEPFPDVCGLVVPRIFTGWKSSFKAPTYRVLLMKFHQTPYCKPVVSIVTFFSLLTKTSEQLYCFTINMLVEMKLSSGRDKCLFIDFYFNHLPPKRFYRFLNNLGELKSCSTRKVEERKANKRKLQQISNVALWHGTEILPERVINS